MDLPVPQTEREAENIGYTEGIDWFDRYLKKTDPISDDPAVLASIGAEWHERLWPNQRGPSTGFYETWRREFQRGVAVRWSGQNIALPEIWPEGEIASVP